MGRSGLNSLLGILLGRMVLLRGKAYMCLPHDSLNIYARVSKTAGILHWEWHAITWNLYVEFVQGNCIVMYGYVCKN